MNSRPQLAEVSIQGIWKHTTCVTRVFFLPLFSRNFDDRLSSNFHRFVILCICWDTPTVKTGLWQLPIVSSVSQTKHRLFCLPGKGYRPVYHVMWSLCNWYPAFFLLSGNLLRHIFCLSSSKKLSPGPNFIELLSTKICLAWNFFLGKNRTIN